MRGSCIALAVVLLSGCGFGLYDDNGGTDPGQWWPWICPDGGDAAPEAGCLPPRCTDGGADARRDAGC